MHFDKRSIPTDSIVAVVGANGYMAVEACEKLLQAGYRVRGTVRNVERHRDWMHKLFDKDWPGKFELVQVPDFEAPGAFDDAFNGTCKLQSIPNLRQLAEQALHVGVSGVIYPSMPTILHLDPAKVVDPMVRGVVNSLEAAARAGIRRYVLSSSSKAVATVSYGSPPLELTVDTFNHEAIAEAYKESSDVSFDRMVTVYGAGRASAELAFWSWVKEHNPPFVANCIVPDGQFGRVLDTEGINTTAASSNGQLKNALQGDWKSIGFQLGKSIKFPHQGSLLRVTSEVALS